MKRYVVLGNDSLPILPVARYLKYLDSVNRSRNTLCSYAHGLKLFFEYMDLRGLDYRNISLDDMGRFVLWLKNPYRSAELHPVRPTEQARANSTINQIISIVSGFYDYLWRQDDLAVNLSEKMRTYLPARGRAFKSFLHHLAGGRPAQANILRQKTPKARPKTLSEQEVQALIDACNTQRDKLLLRLLYESSMRIGEALAIWIEDVDIGSRRLHIRDRGQLPNDAEIKTTASCRAVDVSADLVNQILDYIAVVHTDDLETNHLFVKLHGRNVGQPLAYPDVSDLFVRLKKKTGIDASAHVLRHSSLTRLAQAGWKPEHLRIRAGHAHFQTTYQMYVHPTDEDVRQDWERSLQAMDLDGSTTQELTG